MKVLAALCAITSLCLSASPARAQEGSQRPRLLLESLDGERRELDLAGLAIEDPRTRDAYLIRPLGFSAAPAPEAEGQVVRILLADGDELRGHISGGAGEALLLEMIGGVELPIDIAKIESVLVPANLPRGQLEPLEAPAEGDRVYRRTGARLDRIDGTVESFVPEGIRFESVLGTKTFPWDEVAGLFVEVFEESGSSPDSVRTPVVCDLIDGSRVRGGLLRIDATHCRLQVAGAELALSLGNVLEIVVDDGVLLFLSDVPALREQGKGVPFQDEQGGDELGMVWPHQIDRNVAGGELKTSGRGWRRGIGMHAPTRVVWSLDGEYRRLRGHVSVDDSALWNPEEARGSVIFRILLDGKQAWESSVIRGGDGLITVPTLELGTARELTLEADMAGDFRGDRANWLRMVLIR